jgi:hypothetical protein
MLILPLGEGMEFDEEFDHHVAASQLKQAAIVNLVNFSH